MRSAPPRQPHGQRRHNKCGAFLGPASTKFNLPLRTGVASTICRGSRSIGRSFGNFGTQTRKMAFQPLRNQSTIEDFQPTSSGETTAAASIAFNSEVTRHQEQAALKAN